MESISDIIRHVINYDAFSGHQTEGGILVGTSNWYDELIKTGASAVPLIERVILDIDLDGIGSSAELSSRYYGFSLLVMAYLELVPDNEQARIAGVLRSLHGPVFCEVAFSICRLWGRMFGPNRRLYLSPELESALLSVEEEGAKDLHECVARLILYRTQSAGRL